MRLISYRMRIRMCAWQSVKFNSGMSSSQMAEMQAGSDISELLSAHRGLVSDRITERKVRAYHKQPSVL